MSLPANSEALEALIAERGDKGAVVEQLLRTVVVVPVDIDERTGDVAPVTLTQDGRVNAVCFTRADVAEQMRARTTHFATMPATSLVLRMPDGMGLLLFTPHGNVALEPALLSEIRRSTQEATDDPPPPDS